MKKKNNPIQAISDRENKTHQTNRNKKLNGSIFHSNVKSVLSVKTADKHQIIREELIGVL